MKLICIDKNLKSDVDTKKKSLEFAFYVKPETAIIPKKQPFFLPDFSNEIMAHAELVLHINKVGKNILPKFAKTYYDSIAVSIRFTAFDTLQNCLTNSMPWTKAVAFDGSSLISEFISINLINKDTLSYSLFKNNNLFQKYFIKNLNVAFDNIISEVSKYITLKQGDVICCGISDHQISVQKDNVFSATLDEFTSISCKIK